jgi:hypothetical protein
MTARFQLEDYYILLDDITKNPHKALKNSQESSKKPLKNHKITFKKIGTESVSVYDPVL